MKIINKLVKNIVKGVPFFKPQELRLAEEKRRMQRELQDQGHSRKAAMRAVSDHFAQIDASHEN